MEARLSDAKVLKLKSELSAMQARNKCTKREMLSLVGSLSFACKVIVPGRSFLSRLINLTCTVREMYHKLYLNKQVRKDLILWEKFLTSWNGRNFFLEKLTTPSEKIEFFTDAASTKGYGAYFQGRWFSAPWESHQLQYSMSAMELYPIVVSALVWGQMWERKRIVVHCDNEGTVGVINKGYCSKSPIAELLRELMFCSMTNNFQLKAVHIPGKKNIKADLLSRLQIHQFHQLFPEADQQPTVLPQSVLSLKTL